MRSTWAWLQNTDSEVCLCESFVIQHACVNRLTCNKQNQKVKTREPKGSVESPCSPMCLIGPSFSHLADTRSQQDVIFERGHVHNHLPPSQIGTSFGLLFLLKQYGLLTGISTKHSSSRRSHQWLVCIFTGWFLKVVCEYPINGRLSIRSYQVVFTKVRHVEACNPLATRQGFFANLKCTQQKKFKTEGLDSQCAWCPHTYWIETNCCQRQVLPMIEKKNQTNHLYDLGDLISHQAILNGKGIVAQKKAAT